MKISAPQPAAKNAQASPDVAQPGSSTAKAPAMRGAASSLIDPETRSRRAEILGHDAQTVVRASRDAGSGRPALSRSLAALGRRVQRHLFLDTPQDLRQLEDMGMWWVMACEWKYQINLDDSNLEADPKDFVTSLGDPSLLKRVIPAKEHVVMSAHGLGSGEYVLIGSDDIAKAEDKKKEIAAAYLKATGKEMTDAIFYPLYCYMAEDKGIWKKGGLGKGPVIAPNLKKVASIDGTKGLGDWAGGKYITKNGGWVKASNAGIAELTSYKKAGEHKKNLLVKALNKIYDEIKTEFAEFASQVSETGSAPSPFDLEEDNGDAAADTNDLVEAAEEFDQSPMATVASSDDSSGGSGDK